MTELEISPDLRLPAEAVTETFAILAKRGGGKTYTASVMAEEMLKRSLQVVVVDPVGACWGLRASADGDREGLSIVVIGGEHGDIPLDAAAGKAVADAVVEERLSAILDLSLLRKGEQIRFMTDFCERLYHKNREPLHIFLDEADAFAPQRPMRGQERLLGAVEDLVRRGRKRGIGVTLITQRSAVLNKDVLTQAEVLVALRTTAPHDRRAIDEWIKINGTPEQREELMKSLPSLPVGTAWFWSPGWLDVFRRVKVRERETFDSSATPKVGQKIDPPKKLAEVDLTRLRERLGGVTDLRTPDDTRRLQRRIVELEGQLKERSAPRVGRVEVPILSEGQLAELREASGKLSAIAGELLSALAKAAAANGSRQPTASHVAPPPAERATAAVTTAQSSTDGRHLRAGEVEMLKALARFKYLGGLTRNRLALLSGYKRSGTFDAYAGTLLRAGLAARDAGSGRMSITEAGSEYLGSDAPQALTGGDELQKAFAEKLKKGERKMLEVLIGNYPRGLTRDELAQLSGYARGGTFDAYVATLARNELAAKEGGLLRASENLFLT